MLQIRNGLSMVFEGYEGLKEEEMSVPEIMKSQLFVVHHLAGYKGKKKEAKIKESLEKLNKYFYSFRDVLSEKQGAYDVGLKNLEVLMGEI